MGKIVSFSYFSGIITHLLIISVMIIFVLLRDASTIVSVGMVIFAGVASFLLRSNSENIFKYSQDKLEVENAWFSSSAYKYSFKNISKVETKTGLSEVFFVILNNGETKGFGIYGSDRDEIEEMIVYINKQIGLVKTQSNVK